MTPTGAEFAGQSPAPISLLPRPARAPRQAFLRALVVTTALVPALFGVAAGQANPVAAAQPQAKRAHAVRRTGDIKIDGRLDDAAWKNASFMSDFRQKEPVENGEPQDVTEVAFLYDERALYVGARLRSKSPGMIRRGLSRRDQYGDAEHIVISLDPYLDRRTAYSFSVTSSGVRRDYYHSRDTEDFAFRDFTYDPVWQARTTIDTTGWTAEVRIPFSQLRFNKRPVQEWGLNINRWIPNRNEDIYWVVVPRNETGFVSRFGTLEGIEGIKPSRRLEILPYVASNGTFEGAPNRANPFNPDGRTVSVRAGADVKMGMGPNLTLDATINPDFGQVEADPAEVNLTAFETYFSERRPFFTEGSQLLQGNVGNYFYSRRIGGTPRGPVEGDFIDLPHSTTIVSAAKLTGRLANGLSIGALGAVTGRETAHTFDSLSARFDTVTVEPRTGYGVIRVQQQFGRNASTVGVTVSGMGRTGLGSEPSLLHFLSRDAVAGGADWILRFARGRYEVSGHVGGSYVAGDTAAIRGIQESSTHYLQRPDYRNHPIDPRRRSLTGYTGRLRWDKNAGNWLSGAEVSVESPGFETNDMGRAQNVDDLDMNAAVNYRWTRPGRLFRQATLGVFTRSNWNFDGVRTVTELSLLSRHTWRNFFTSSLNVGIRTRAVSDILTRGGPLMGTGRGWNASGGLGSNFAGSTQWTSNFEIGKGELGDWFAVLRGGVSLRPSSALGVSINPSLVQSRDPRQYIGTLEDGLAATYGRRYVFGNIRRSTIAAQVRINYTFSPSLTLEGYAEPFAASGKYSAIGELDQPRSRNLRVYGSDGTVVTGETAAGFTVADARNAKSFFIDNPDFNVLSFRSNVVLRWEWQPGSTLFLVWQQNRSTFCSPSTPSDCRRGLRPGDLVSLGSLSNALRATGDNFLAVKVSYWVPVN
ncbi:MAG: DUF5916 domain-containing protein [Gemmatimonadota bacterium]